MVSWAEEEFPSFFLIKTAFTACVKDRPCAPSSNPGDEETSVPSTSKVISVENDDAFEMMHSTDETTSSEENIGMSGIKRYQQRYCTEGIVTYLVHEG